MLLRQLEYLTALAREGHFGRAARTCHVSQPALSGGIHRLEEELGIQIVQRSQRFNGFTAEGAEVLRWAQRVLAGQEDLVQTLATMRGSLTGVLRVGAIPTALTVASLFTQPLHERHPLVRFELRSMSSIAIVDALNAADLDVGISYVDGEPLGKARLMPLYRERYMFLAPPERRPTTQPVTWAEAAEAPLCLLTPDMQNRRILDGYFTQAGASATPVVEADTVSAIYAHATAMRLCSVIPHTWLHNSVTPPDFVVLPMVEPRRSLHVGLVLPPQRPSSVLTQAFVEEARKVDVSGSMTADDGHRQP
jgi:DNA-binding transcriptional LysR family regulator